MHVHIDIRENTKQMSEKIHKHIKKFNMVNHLTRIPSGIWSRLYGSFPSALNIWSKVWPWILIWAYV